MSVDIDLWSGRRFESERWSESIIYVNVFQVTVRLKPGHLLAMNNRKALHGRQEYQSNGGVRFLQVRIVHFSESLIVD